MSKEILDRLPYSKECLLLAYRGSVAHGTYVPPSDPDSIDDIDFMGVVLAPKEHYIGLTQWGNSGTREVFHEELDLVEYELRKMVGLLLKCNPNVLSILNLKPEYYLLVTPEGQRLIENKNIFASKEAYYSFLGYGKSQLQQMGRCAGRGFRGKKRSGLIEKYGYDTKNAAHCIRLIRMGIEFLNSGTLQVDRSGIDADELLAIKKGAWSFDRAKDEAQNLFSKAAEAMKTSPLPPKPDYIGAEVLVMDILDRYIRK